jgi:hypothetical protein
MIASFASRSIRKEVSTTRPSTRPASAALRRPAPMLAATWSTVTGASKVRVLPSGSVITGMIKKPLLSGSSGSRNW